MKLLYKPCPEGNYEHRLVSECGRVEMGFHRVLYGHRVRAGYVGEDWVHLDWCGGSMTKDLGQLYGICKTILESREVGNCFEGLPGHSTIKPFFADEKFLKIITKIAEKAKKK